MKWPGPLTGTPPGPSGGPFRVYPGRMCVGQRGLRRLGPRTGDRAVRAVVRPVEKPLDDKLFENCPARRIVKLPEPTRLRER